MYIHSTSVFLTEPTDDLLLLKKELASYAKEKFRRANRFILLSLIGGYKCIYHHKTDNIGAIYLTTENGNLKNTESVLEQIYHKQELPMPYNFINTMSNTASFYVAQKLNISGKNLTVSSINLSFERGLELLKVDFASDIITEALIGGVDESVIYKDASDSMLEHRNEKQIIQQTIQKWYGNPDKLEGSAWLYITSEKQGAVGELVDIKSFISREDGMDWLKAKDLDHADVVVSFGVLVEPPERADWKKNNRYETEFDYIREYGYFDSITSCGVSLFMEKYENKYLVHINKDVQGQYVILIVKSGAVGC